MEMYKNFKIENDENKYNYNLYSQEENEKKFDTLLDGILASNINQIKNRQT